MPVRARCAPSAPARAARLTRESRRPRLPARSWRHAPRTAASPVDSARAPVSPERLAELVDARTAETTHRDHERRERPNEVAVDLAIGEDEASAGCRHQRACRVRVESSIEELLGGYGPRHAARLRPEAIAHERAPPGLRGDHLAEVEAT